MNQGLVLKTVLHQAFLTNTVNLLDHDVTGLVTTPTPHAMARKNERDYMLHKLLMYAFVTFFKLHVDF